MSLAIKNGPNAIAELKIPSPQDVSQGNVSLNNCKNATIGTKVDCHGNLIVNQYLNVGDSNSKLYNVKNGINGLIVTDSAAKVDWKQKILKLKYVWGSLIFAVVITAISCILFFPQRVENDSTKDVAYSLNYTLQLISRQQWSKFKTELEDCNDLKIRPAKFVVMSHTVSSTCDKPSICENLMITMQSDHIRRGYCDIGYNFVIADDGYIYEGRGWGIFGAHTFGYNCGSIGVGLMGNFNTNYPSELLLQSLHLLIEEGLQINEITRDYKLIFQSQVNGNTSPGVNVEQVLKKWDHWSNITKDDELC